MDPVPEPTVKDKQNIKKPNKTERFSQRLILLGFTRGAMREIMAGDCEAAICNYPVENYFTSCWPPVMERQRLSASR